MGLLQNLAERVKRFFTEDVKSAVDRIHVGLIDAENGVGYPEKTGRLTVDQIAETYVQSPLIQGLISIGAQACKAPVWKIVQVQKNGKTKDRKSGYPHEVLHWVNAHMSFADLIGKTYTNYRLYGNAYWAIEPTPVEHRRRFPNAPEYSIYPLDPRYVKIVTDPDTNRLGYIYSEVYPGYRNSMSEDDGKGSRPKSIYFPDDLVLHFKTENPKEYWLGLSAIDALSYDLQIDRFQKRQQRNFYSNAALLNGVLESDSEISNDEIKRLKKEFQNQYSGAKNAYRILVLENGIKYKPMPAVTDDGVSDKVLNNVATSHEAVLGVPLVLLNPPAGADLTHAEFVMWQYNIQPFLKDHVAPLITKRLCQVVDSRLEFRFDFSDIDALRYQDLNRTRSEVAHVNIGAKTVNEIRISRQMEPYTGDLAEFGDTPRPLFDIMMKEKTEGSPDSPDASPSLTLPGSEGGRDQSEYGEAEMLDETGEK